MEYILKNCDDMANDLGANDVVVLIAGANNIAGVNPGNVAPARTIWCELMRFLKSHAHTKFIIVNQFHRHDLAYNCLINNEIRQVNGDLQKLDDMENVTVVNMSSTARRYFTRHGQHLNGAGKLFLCEKLLEVISKIERNDRHNSPPVGLHPHEEVTEEGMEHTSHGSGVFLQPTGSSTSNQNVTVPKDLLPASIDSTTSSSATFSHALPNSEAPPTARHWGLSSPSPHQRDSDYTSHPLCMINGSKNSIVKSYLEVE